MKPLIVMPTYNEAPNMEKIIRMVFSNTANLAPTHLLVVDDNSPDGTAAIVKSLMQNEFNGSLFLLQRDRKYGLGTAYILGFKWALDKGYSFICEMDADFSHDPKDLIRLFVACEKDGADVAVGSRYISGVNVVNWPMSRVIISYFASVYVRLITRMQVRDATAGFVCYKKEVLETIELSKIRFKGYAFQIEMKFTAWKYGFNIIELPIIFTDRKEGTSKMSGKIVNEAIWGVIRLKWGSFFKKYKRNG